MPFSDEIVGFQRPKLQTDETVDREGEESFFFLTSAVVRGREVSVSRENLDSEVDSLDLCRV